MSWYSYKPYVAVAARRAQAKKEMQKFRKKGEKIQPIEINGRIIARTFWGKAWCVHLKLRLLTKLPEVYSSTILTKATIRSKLLYSISTKKKVAALLLWGNIIYVNLILMKNKRNALLQPSSGLWMRSCFLGFLQ